MGGEPLENYGLPGRMDTNRGRAPLLRGNRINLSPHDIPPRGGTLATTATRHRTTYPLGGDPSKTNFEARHEFSHKGEPLEKIWLAGADGHRSGLGALVQGQTWGVCGAGPT